MCVWEKAGISERENEIIREPKSNNKTLHYYYKHISMTKWEATEIKIEFWFKAAIQCPKEFEV